MYLGLALVIQRRVYNRAKTPPMALFYTWSVYQTWLNQQTRIQFKRVYNLNA